MYSKPSIAACVTAPADTTCYFVMLTAVYCFEKLLFCLSIVIFKKNRN